MENSGFMAGDVVLGIFVLIFCVIGFMKGVVQQFFGILAFVLATLASVLTPYFVKIPPIEGLSPLWAYIVFCVLLWVPAFLILNSVGKFVAGKIAKKGPAFADRIWGFIFGGLKGCIIVALVVFFLDIIPVEGKISKLLAKSKIAAFIQTYNPVIKIHLMQNLQTLISAMEDADYVEILSKDENFQELKNKKSIQDILDDIELEKVIKDNQYLRFFANSKIQALTKDNDTMRLLMSLDIDKIVIKNI